MFARIGLGERDETRLTVLRSSFLGTAPRQGRRSNSVNQDIQGALQRVALVRQRPYSVSQFCTWNCGEFLNSDNPIRPFMFNSRRETRKGCISTCIAQGGHDARCVDS